MIGADDEKGSGNFVLSVWLNEMIAKRLNWKKFIIIYQNFWDEAHYLECSDYWSHLHRYIHNVSAFFRCFMSHSGVHTESRTEPFIWITGIDCSNSVNWMTVATNWVVFSRTGVQDGSRSKTNQASFYRSRRGGRLFVAASHQTRLDTKSKARRPIKVGIKGRGGRERAETWTLLVSAADRLT